MIKVIANYCKNYYRYRKEKKKTRRKKGRNGREKEGRPGWPKERNIKN